MLNYGMSIRKDFEEAQKQFDDYLYPNGKDKSPVKIYDNVEPISDKEWGMLRSDIYSRKNNIGLGLLPKFKVHYDDGWYPSKEEFIETVNRLYENLQNCHDALKSQSPTDNAIFEDLMEEYNNILNQRTMDEGVADKLLKGKAKKIQIKIEDYLKKKVEADETLTDEMLAFKGVDALRDDMYFEKVLKPQLPKPPKPPLEDRVAKTVVDGEQDAMVKTIKKQKRTIKALRIFGKMPDQDTMKELIDECRFKTTDLCNDSELGRKLGKNSETARSWVEKLGLSYYAYNPKHER